MNKIKVIFGIAIGVIALITIVGYVNLSYQNTESGTESDEETWQLLQKTYFDSKCKEKYMGQNDAMQKCFDRVAEEQRLHPPTKPEP